MTEYNKYSNIAYHEFPNGEIVICSSDKSGDIIFYFCSENKILTNNTKTILADGTLVEVSGNEKTRLTNTEYDKRNKVLYLNNKKESYYLDEQYRPIKYESFRGCTELREYDDDDNLTYVELSKNLWVRRAFDDGGETITHEDSNGNWWDKKLMTNIIENPYR